MSIGKGRRRLCESGGYGLSDEASVRLRREMYSRIENVGVVGKVEFMGLNSERSISWGGQDLRRLRGGWLGKQVPNAECNKNPNVKLYFHQNPTYFALLTMYSCIPF